MINDKTQVNRILVITLSNAGDIILTTPVIRMLREEFPSSRMDVMVGPAGKEIFETDPNVFKLIIYDKHLPITDKRRLQLKLKKLKYDLVVDLRNTVFPLLIGPKFRTATIQRFPSHIVHSRDRHLYRLESLGIKNRPVSSYIHITKNDETHTDDLIKKLGIEDPIVCINAGAKSHLKRWTQEGFAEVADRMIEQCRVNVIFTGLEEDRAIVSAIMGRMRQKAYELVGKLNIRQLGYLIKRSRLLVTNDSAPLHLGCAVGTKVLAVFGPTDPKKYGPTGEFDSVVNKKLSCSPCESAVCEKNYECMKLISPDDVFYAAKIMVEGYE